MTILAFDEMNIVRAGRGLERGVHGRDVEAAIGQARMAIGARGARVLVVSGVAGQAAQPFMNAHAGAVVARIDLESIVRCVALVAKPLARIRRHLHRARAVAHDRQRQNGRL